MHYEPPTITVSGENLQNGKIQIIFDDNGYDIPHFLASEAELGELIEWLNSDMPQPLGFSQYTLDKDTQISWHTGYLFSATENHDKISLHEESGQVESQESAGFSVLSSNFVRISRSDLLSACNILLNNKSPVSHER